MPPGIEQPQLIQEAEAVTALGEHPLQALVVGVHGVVAQHQQRRLIELGEALQRHGAEHEGGLYPLGGQFGPPGGTLPPVRDGLAVLVKLVACQDQCHRQHQGNVGGDGAAAIGLEGDTPRAR